MNKMKKRKINTRLNRKKSKRMQKKRPKAKKRDQSEDASCQERSSMRIGKKRKGEEGRKEASDPIEERKKLV